MENGANATIKLSGEESYGMKLAAYANPGGTASMINKGKIILQDNGKDKANKSAAMALMNDASVGASTATNNASKIVSAGKVRLDYGKALNSGTIELKT